VQQFVNVTAALANDFSITANPSAISVVKGQSGASTIGTAVVTGTAGTINLSVAFASNGLAPTLNPAVVTAGGSSTLTVTPSLALPPGTYTVIVTGTEGPASHGTSLTVILTPAPSDFAISASPSSLTAVQGASPSPVITISTTVVTGTADAINLTATSSPIGLGATLGSTVVNAGAGSTLTIFIGALTTPGVYTITVTGTEGSAMHSVLVTVTVTAAASDFVIRVAPSSLTIVQGNSATIDIGTTPVTGTADAINLGAASSPSGLTTSLNPQVVTAGGTSTLTISAGATITPGTYTVTVTGVEGTATHSTFVTVTVAAAPSDFAISASPNILTIVNESFGTSTISTTFVTGTPDQISLSAVMSPPAADLSPSFNPTVVTAGSASTLTIAVDGLALPGSYTVIVTGTEGGVVHRTTVTVTVTAIPPDFSISSSPSSLTVVQGNSGTSTISTAITAGMTAQAISLSEISTPGGLATGLSPAVITSGGASTLTVSPDFSTAPGTYVVTVTGVEASGATHSTSVTITVTAGLRDFSISANPSALRIVQGSSAASSISTAAIGGPGTIVLSNSAPVGGLSATLTPTSISAGGSSTITVSAAYTTAPGNYTVTVTGTEGPNAHSTVISVIVTIKGIVNGGFETGDLTGWTATGVTAIVRTSHSGAFAARVGSTSPSTDSNLSQTFTVPAAGGKLTFWYRMSCLDKVKNDWFTATLHDGVTGTTATVQSPICSKIATWTR
jgi:hypothetical protein